MPTGRPERRISPSLDRARRSASCIARIRGHGCGASAVSTGRRSRSRSRLQSFGGDRARQATSCASARAARHAGKGRDTAAPGLGAATASVFCRFRKLAPCRRDARGATAASAWVTRLIRSAIVRCRGPFQFSDQPSELLRMQCKTRFHKPGPRRRPDCQLFVPARPSLRLGSDT
jgi:hypothetical protein